MLKEKSMEAILPKGERQYQINMVLRRLDSDTTLLETLVTDLYSRLEPLLGEGLSKEGKAIQDTKTCPIASELRTYGDRVISVNHQLRCILERLEISM